MNYKLLYEFVQKYFVLHEHSAIEISLSTYVCYDPDGLFWLNLYLPKALKKLIGAFYSCIRGLYYSGGRTNRGGHSNRTSTVFYMVMLSSVKRT